MNCPDCHKKIKHKRAQKHCWISQCKCQKIFVAAKSKFEAKELVKIVIKNIDDE
jgi:ribosomal protein L37AE/L43A